MMLRGLSAQEILSLWETMQQQHPVKQALTILHLVIPEHTPDALLTLSIGQRDAYLLTVREKTFGSQFVSYAECPVCHERLEFSFSAADISGEPDGTQGHGVYQETIEAYTLHFRLPNSVDLVAIAHCHDVATARTLLLQRCIEHVERDDVSVPLVDVPQTITDTLAEHMAHYDPQADVTFNLSCPACEQEWSVVFDVLLFLWTEICVQARRLLHEVHILARAYGWSEADILSLSAIRRQFYLEMVS